MKLTAILFAAALVPATAFAGGGSNSTNPVDMAQMQGQTKTDEPVLGATVMELSSDLRTQFGAPTDSGLLVSKVDSGGPAQRAGIKVGDIITKVGTNKLTTASDVDTFLGAAQKGGQKVAIQVIRNQKTLHLNVMPAASQKFPSATQGTQDTPGSTSGPSGPSGPSGSDDM